MMVVMDVNGAPSTETMTERSELQADFRQASLYHLDLRPTPTHHYANYVDRKYSLMPSETAIASFVLIEMRSDSGSCQETSSESSGTSSTSHDSCETAENVSENWKITFYYVNKWLMHTESCS